MSVSNASTSKDEVELAVWHWVQPRIQKYTVVLADDQLVAREAGEREGAVDSGHDSNQQQSRSTKQSSKGSKNTSISSLNMSLLGNMKIKWIRKTALCLEKTL